MLRAAGCLPLVALAWVFLRPAGAALATVILVLSFAFELSCGQLLLVFALAIAAGAAGLIPWWAAIPMGMLLPVVAKLWAVIPDFYRKVLLGEDTPLDQAASGFLIRQWARATAPWLVVLVMTCARHWWPVLLLAIPVYFLMRIKIIRAVITGAIIGYFFRHGADWGFVALLIVPAFLASKGRFLPAVVWDTVLLLVRGLDAGVLVLLALAAAGLLAPVVTPRPRRHHPLPRPRYRDGPGRAWRLSRADRAITGGDTYRAQRLLRAALSAGGPHALGQPDLCARLALAAVDDGRLQDAGDAVNSAVTHVAAYARALTWLRAEILVALNRDDEAVQLIEPILKGEQALTVSERVCYRLSLATALAGTGEHTRSAEAASGALSLTGRRGWPLERARAYRLIAEAQEEQGRFKEALAQAEHAQAALMTNWWSQYLVNGGGGQSRLIRFLAGPIGRLFTEHSRTEITLRRIQAEVPGKDSKYPLAELDENADLLAIQGQWGIVADLLVTLARNEMRPPKEADESNVDSPEKRLAKALGYLLRALRELDRNRSTLRSPRDRAAWSARLHEALALALALAVQSGDARLQAELMEFGRIQTLPHFDSAPARDGQIALTVPPVIRVRNRAQVSRYWDAARPAPVDLETAAGAAAGPGAWWLSYWQSGSLLYWSLVPPTGPVAGGRMDFSPASQLRTALRALQEGLPVLLDGEQAAAMDWRMASSPLLSDPPDERQASARLADLLLPGALLTALRARLKTSSEPLPLAIVPSAGLAFVPWSLLVLSDLDDERTVRLAQAADWVLAPAASLATSLLQRRRPMGPFPLRLAIADTWQDPGLAALPAARRQATALPANVEVLGGRHWTTHTATLAAVRAAFARLDPASTVLFACHALPAPEDLTAQGGLVLAEPGPGGQPRLLTPSDVVAMAADGIAAPAQVLLLACDSSDLSSSAAGEWLTTAPAMLAAGSRAIVTTLFPVRDSAGDDDPVLGAAIAGQDLRAAVRGLQRSGARAWDTRGPRTFQETPLQWAAYAIVAAHQATPADAQLPVPGLSPRLKDTLYGAALNTSPIRRTVHTGHLLARYLDGPGAMAYGLFTNYSILVVAVLGLANWILRSERGEKPAGRLIPGADLLRALTQAQSAVAREGRDIEPEDVLRCALSEQSPALKLVRFMAFARMQRIEHIRNLLEFTLARDPLNQKASTRAKEKRELAAFVRHIEALYSPRTTRGLE